MKHVEKRGGCSPALGAEDVEPGPRQTELVCGSVCSSLRHGAPSSVRRDPTAPDRAAARNRLCDGMKPHGGGRDTPRSTPAPCSQRQGLVCLRCCFSLSPLTSLSAQIATRLCHRVPSAFSHSDDRVPAAGAVPRVCGPSCCHSRGRGAGGCGKPACGDASGPQTVARAARVGSRFSQRLPLRTARRTLSFPDNIRGKEGTFQGPQSRSHQSSTERSFLSEVKTFPERTGP